MTHIDLFDEIFFADSKTQFFEKYVFQTLKLTFDIFTTCVAHSQRTSTLISKREKAVSLVTVTIATDVVLVTGIHGNTLLVTTVLYTAVNVTAFF